MARYKLSTGLWTVNERPECSSDKEAWELLRTSLLGKYAVLYKEVKMPVDVVNRAEYLESFNSKYTSQKWDVDNPSMTTWIPVLIGITNDEYDVTSAPTTERQFLTKILELGAQLDQSVSPMEACMIINDAEILYRKHIQQLKP